MTGRQPEPFWASQRGLILEAMVALAAVRWLAGFEVAVLVGLGLVAGYVVWLSRLQRE